MIFEHVNRLKLSQELHDAGVVCHVFAIDDSSEYGANIIFADGTDMDLVQSIVDAHDPTPIAPQPSQDDFLLDLELRMTMLELGLTI